MDVARCHSELTKLLTECRVYTTTSGFACPGCILIKTTHIPACNYKLNGLGDAFYLLDVAPHLPNAVAVAPEGETSLHGPFQAQPFQAQFRFDAEAGKTYYLKYSFDASLSGHTHLVLMEATKGAKEVRSLHLAHLAEH